MTIELIADQLCYPECPRWHNNTLWFSSVFRGEVCTLDAPHLISVQQKFNSPIAGLGWLPDNSLLVVEPFKQTLTQVHQDGTHTTYQDLSNQDQVISNDLFVHPNGLAYVSGMGNNYLIDHSPKPCSILSVDCNNAINEVASDLLCPNGFAYDQARQHLYVAESHANRITRFNCALNGSLSHRETYYQFENGDSPDGIDLDSDGNLWVACNNHKVVLLRDCQIQQTIQFDQHPLACLSPNTNDKEVYVLTTDSFDPEQVCNYPNGKIYRIA
ncbi:SMP-30/gluconolactonase/LRE family protein [Vibrio sp. S4M6]|uniref:SMP-30/gluconolactonase/LRE family protein n=1 Tax=Vibrio sinus TaxID=2946865 RepID=UPI00202AB132|nr:SMP-30/gluconolactonase/LRE family protein [Vibrio sinus]MCL9779821.1 SMP-30/gluconolactonase/LRE family protein [Vibrio sinus]